jgi:hypothetical protein
MNLKRIITKLYQYSTITIIILLVGIVFRIINGGEFDNGQIIRGFIILTVYFLIWITNWFFQSK